MEVSQNGNLVPKSLLSNESIIFTYLSVKHDIVAIDTRLKQLELYIEEKNKEFEKMFLSGNGDGVGVLQQLAKAMGADFPVEEIREQKEQAIAKLRSKTEVPLKNELKYKATILNELQLAFDILKDTHPEMVQKYNEHFLLTTSM